MVISYNGLMLWMCYGVNCVRGNLFIDFFRDHFLPDIGQDILNGGRVQLVVRAIFYIIYYT